MKRAGGNSPKTTGAEKNNAMTPSMAEEARNAASVGDNRACSDGGSRKDKYGNGTATAEGRVGTMQPICHGNRQGEELLCLWRFQAYGLLLQKLRKRENRAGKKNGI